MRRWILTLSVVLFPAVASAAPIIVTFAAGVDNVSQTYIENGFRFYTTHSGVNLRFYDLQGNRYLRWTGNVVFVEAVGGGTFDFDSFIWRFPTGTNPNNLLCPYNGCPAAGYVPLSGTNVLPSRFDNISGAYFDPNFFQFFNQGGSITNAVFNTVDTATVIPEPASLFMLASGLAGAAVRRSRRRSPAPSGGRRRPRPPDSPL